MAKISVRLMRISLPFTVGEGRQIAVNTGTAGRHTVHLIKSFGAAKAIAMTILPPFRRFALQIPCRARIELFRVAKS